MKSYLDLAKQYASDFETSWEAAATMAAIVQAEAAERQAAALEQLVTQGANLEKWLYNIHSQLWRIAVALEVQEQSGELAESVKIYGTE